MNVRYIIYMHNIGKFEYHLREIRSKLNLFYEYYYNSKITIPCSGFKFKEPFKIGTLAENDMLVYGIKYSDDIEYDNKKRHYGDIYFEICIIDNNQPLNYVTNFRYKQTVSLYELYVGKSILSDSFGQPLSYQINTDFLSDILVYMVNYSNYDLNRKIVELSALNAVSSTNPSLEDYIKLQKYFYYLNRYILRNDFSKALNNYLNSKSITEEEYREMNSKSETYIIKNT